MKSFAIFKTITLAMMLALLALPVTVVNAQPEEEEEEPIQARPNPMDSRTRMKGMSRSWDPTDRVKDDGEHGDGKAQMRAPASRSMPGQQMQGAPQTMRPGAGRSYEGVDGESRGNPMGMRHGPAGIQSPQMQQGGGMMSPQQMQQQQ